MRRWRFKALLLPWTPPRRVAELCCRAAAVLRGQQMGTRDRGARQMENLWERGVRRSVRDGVASFARGKLEEGAVVIYSDAWGRLWGEALRIDGLSSGPSDI